MYVELYSVIFAMDRFGDVEAYYDTYNGEFTDNEYAKTDFESYIYVPKYDEVSIAKKFLKTSPDHSLKKYVNSIPEKNFLTNFWNILYKLNIDSEFKDFREEEKKNIAIKWCEDNNIKFTTKFNRQKS